MKRLALLCLLAGCPAKPATTTPTTDQGGAGCPAASGVYVASYVVQEPGKGRSGWVVPLHAMKTDGGAAVPDYQQLDAATAQASGVPAAPSGTLWLATASAPPCKATIGSYYAAKGDGAASLTYGIEINGCPAPTDPQEGGGIVLVSDASPSGCRFEVPRPVAARLGEMDAQKQWQRPAKQTPIPPALAAVIPPHDCQAPSCEQLWAIGEVDIANKPVAWSAAINWLQVGDPAQACQWKAERFSGFFVPGGDGAPVKITEGQDHPLVLSAVLADGGGAKVLLGEGPGEYATYDLIPGGAKLAHHVTWMVTPEDAWEAVDHLGPLCEPPDAKH